MIQASLLMLPLAALGGWLFGASNKRKQVVRQTPSLSHEYIVGLNYLLNEQPDKAVDVFLKMLEVDSETVETHLALGSLFRRRGEVDRAIRVHQNLIARPHLEKHHRIHALVALGQDYMRAGVLDRAERLFLEAVEMGDNTSTSLRCLRDIYQQEKSWEKAIASAEKLQSLTGEETGLVIAHYYCELAIEASKRNNLETAQQCLNRAIKIDRNCVRASLLQGDYEAKAGHWKAAIRSYQRVKQQNIIYLCEVIDSIVHCYEKLNNEAALVEYLRECLREAPRISIVLVLAERYRHSYDEEAAVEFIAEHLRQRPSTRGLQYLIQLQLNTATGEAKEYLLMLHGLAERLLENKPAYRCHHCGFSGKVLYWQCPSCKNWDSVKPIHGLEGE